MTQIKTEDAHRLTLRIHKADYLALKRYCTETNQTITEVVNLLVHRAVPDKYRENRFELGELLIDSL